MKALLSITGRILLMATLLIVVIPPAIAQPAAYNFHHLKPSDGLSDGDVHCIAQDKYGFIWIGTSYGLNRFDGINIKTYFTRRNDSNSLRYNYVHAIYPGKNGDLWIGTLRGLCRFDYSQGQFVNYKAPRNLSILDIKEDRQGKLWLATEKGLWTVDETTRSIQEFTRNGDSIFLKHFNTRIRQILPTASGQLYFATYRGIKYFNPITSRYGEIKHDSIAGSAYPDIIYSLALDRDDHLWAVSINPQPVLNRINLRDNSITRYSNKSKAPASWAGNFLNQVVVDRNGRIWVVGSRSGLTVFEPGMNTFTEYHSDPLQPKSLLNNHNTFLYEDKDGIMWIGTLGYGVSYFNPDRNLFSTIQPDPENKKSLPGAWCRSACEDMDGNLWLGTGSGLARYNRQSQTFTVWYQLSMP